MGWQEIKCGDIMMTFINSGIFDLHTDMGMYVKQKHTTDIKPLIKLQQQSQTNISVFSACCERNHQRDELMTMIEMLDKAISDNQITKVTNDKSLALNTQRAMMGIEGLGAIDRINDINYLYDKGVRVASLCWNDTNALASGSDDNKQGLTDFGKDVIKRMEQVGMIIDVSHANEQSFWDIINNSNQPLLATHSNAYQLCNHNRNLKDEQLKIIAERGGIIGCVSHAYFIDKSRDVHLDVLVKHIKYIGDLIGYNHVALGFDFPEYYTDHQDQHFNVGSADLIIEAMNKQGISPRDIQQIIYDNAFNFFKNNLKNN